VRLVTFEAAATPGVLVPGVIDGQKVRTIALPRLQDFLAARLSATEGAEYFLEDVRLAAPIPTPPAIRDFFVFEQHVATARGRRGLDVPDFWYLEPVFYFSNPAAVVGPDADIVYPVGVAELDYELELAAVIGADETIAAFTIMNDWSARDVQRGETTVGLGPAKAKDFATSLGPWLVTVDEFSGKAGTMIARVNGTEYSRGEISSAYYSWEQILERAGRNTRLIPGDVIGSGTVGSGCILELGTEAWLQVGDEVELEVQGIGELRNTVVPTRSPIAG
jgi:fumarylacetoacetate (FAA) hydrolase